LRTRRWLAGAAVIVVAVVTYHRALSAYFFDDDFQWLVGAWSFAPENLVAIGRMAHFYRPVIDLYFAMTTPLFGGSPVVFHAASIALHAATGLALFALAQRISGSALYGLSASLFFVVQPAGTHAVAWVGALAETLGALFGCLSILWFLRWRDTARGRWRALSSAAYLLALLAHESSVVFLPVILLADWAFAVDRPSDVGARMPRAAAWVRAYAPLLVLTTAYLAVDLSINSRHYIVREGHYTLGWHVVRNAFHYLVALYVGRRDALNYVFVATGIAALLLRGSGRTRFATAWMLLALAPFLAFTWSNTSRYMYQPAIGLSLLLADAVAGIDRLLAPRLRATLRAGLVGVVITAIALRSMLFAMHNIEGFAAETEMYRRHGAALRQLYGDLPRHSVITPTPEFQKAFPHMFGNALAQWVYQDPTIQVAPY
jgi:hypothetical protein